MSDKGTVVLVTAVAKFGYKHHKLCHQILQPEILKNGKNFMTLGN